MAEALFILKVLSPILTSLIQDEFRVLWGVKKDLQKLEKTLKRINVNLEAADEHQFSNKELKNWLEDLIEAAHEAEDVVDEFATTKAKQSRASGICNKQVCKFLPSPLCFKNILFRHKIGHKLKAVIKCLDECEAKRPNIPSREGHPNRGSENRQGRETDYFVLESKVFGREEDREKIVELLLTCVNSQQNLSIIPIVGMGGIGKTTLAQLVYNDTRVEDHFDLTIWVCVSEDFDHKRLVTKITESASGGISNDMSILKKNLLEKLKGKKFLLVLDDVWNDKANEWERLKDLLSCGDKGSSVLVTTRSKRVAQIMGTILDDYDLKELSMDDCWSLFKECAFWEGRREENPKLVEIGKEIVKKCKGVPLAAKTLGSLMRFKSTEEDEWLSIKDSELWLTLPEDQDDIFPALRLSYINLPHHLRRCFVFCSVFPKDYRMKKEELVHMWMANGLVQYKRGRELEDSHETFNELLGRSFFQDIEKNVFGDIRACKIHDLMHDLAKSVSRDECYSIDSKEAAEKVCERTKHLHFNNGFLLSRDHSTPTMSLDVAKRLRSLIFEWFKSSPKEETEFHPYILKFEFLRILCLHGYPIRKIPLCIGSLIHLRYLNFSSAPIESLPKSIGNLLNLQILKLGGCDHLKKLPNSIGNLLNLQILELGRCDQLDNLPESIGNLLNLKILELGGCDQLDNLPESIGNLGNLQILDMSYCSKLRHLPKELRKMRSLKHLNNEGMGLTHMPTGIGHLRDLQTLPVFVVGENEGCLIKELRELDRIKGKLFIEGLSNVARARDAIDANLRRKQNIDSLGLSWQQLDGEENIDEEDNIDGEENIDEEVLEGLQPHSNLKELSIDGNRGLRFPHWLQASSLPNLVELNLLNCRNYEKMPSVLGQLPSLTSLRIKGLHGVKYMGNELYGSCEQRGFPSLETLDLEEMENLEEISVVEGREHFPGLHRLSIVRCPKLIKISAFPFPSEVILRECGELTLLQGLLKCTRLLSLGISDLEKLVSLGEDLDNFVALESLTICWCWNLVSLPEGLKYLKSLEVLEIKYCENLMSLPEGLKYLKSLKKLEILNCKNLMYVPEGWLQGLTSLKDLRIWDCNNLSSLSGGFNTSCSYALQRLSITSCGALTSLPEGMHFLTALKELEIMDCENLMSVPEGWLQGLTSLKDLSIEDCNKLSSLSGGLNTSCSYALERLSIRNCGALTSLPEGMHHLTALRHLEIANCLTPTSLPEGLEYLTICKCENLTSLPEGMHHLTALEWITLEECPALASLEGIHHLTALRWLEIRECRQLSSLPDRIQDCTSLEKLFIFGCGEELMRRYEKERGAEWHKIAHIPDVRIS